jgi:hypothetical protein
MTKQFRWTIFLLLVAVDTAIIGWLIWTAIVLWSLFDVGPRLLWLAFLSFAALFPFTCWVFRRFKL